MVIVDRQALWSTGRSLASGDKLLTCSCLLEVEWLTLIWGIFSSGCPLLLKAIDKIVYCDNLMLVLFSIEFQVRKQKKQKPNQKETTTKRRGKWERERTIRSYLIFFRNKKKLHKVVNV